MLILASRSQTRKSLLLGAGLRFETEEAGVDERAVESHVEVEGIDAGGLAVRLAEAKAVSVAARHSSAVVIGADQTLALDGRLLHKPSSLAAAARQLDQLRGRTHFLHAGIALAAAGKVIWSHLDSAELVMRHFSDPERDAVLASEGEAILSCVGSYRLEGPSIRLFETVRGDYFSILGLPLLPLLKALRQHAPEVFLERLVP